MIEIIPVLTKKDVKEFAKYPLEFASAGRNAYYGKYYL